MASSIKTNLASIKSIFKPNATQKTRFAKKTFATSLVQ